MESATIDGTIERLIQAKGFGFIRGRGRNQAEFFFHLTDVDGARFDELREGQPVVFIPDETGIRGPRASRVQVMA